MNATKNKPTPTGKRDPLKDKKDLRNIRVLTVICLLAILFSGYYIIRRFYIYPTVKRGDYAPGEFDTLVIYDESNPKDIEFLNKAVAQFALMKDEWRRTVTNSPISPQDIDEAANAIARGVRYATDKRSPAAALDEDECTSIEQYQIDGGLDGLGYRSRDYGLSAPDKAYVDFKNKAVKIVDSIKKLEPRIYV